MNAPIPVLWALSAAFVLLAVPCVYRLVLAHPASDLRCQVNRADEQVEALMYLGMLAMVSPLGGPIPLAGWQALFGLAVLWTVASWALRRRHGQGVSCAPSRCGHHAISVIVMLGMLIGAAGHTGHGADPWLTLSGHSGSLALTPLVLLATIYLCVDIALCMVRMARDNTATTPILFRPRAREATRAIMSAAMATMLLSMT
ncbi:MAG: DUF5134 domain-containing protein [Haloechinothrix sp.]